MQMLIPHDDRPQGDLAPLTQCRTARVLHLAMVSDKGRGGKLSTLSLNRTNMTTSSLARQRMEASLSASQKVREGKSVPIGMILSFYGVVSFHMEVQVFMGFRWVRE